MNSFSTALRLVCFIDERPEDVEVDVVVFAAEGWTEAFDRALRLGRGLERSYTNVEGEIVQWRLAEVQTLDQLSGGPDASRVYSHRVEIKSQDRDPDRLDPESSQPQQSGV